MLRSEGTVAGAGVAPRQSDGATPFQTPAAHPNPAACARPCARRLRARVRARHPPRGQERGGRGARRNEQAGEGPSPAPLPGPPCPGPAPRALRGGGRGRWRRWAPGTQLVARSAEREPDAATAATCAAASKVGDAGRAPAGCAMGRRVGRDVRAAPPLQLWRGRDAGLRTPREPGGARGPKLPVPHA